MLYELIEQGFGEKEDFNCAEKILYGANQVYNLGLDKKALKLSAGFGGGMAIGTVCGALTSSIMVLSHLFVEEIAHESIRIKKLSKELLDRYAEEMGSVDCKPLMKSHRTKEHKCLHVVSAAAKILDDIVLREQKNS
ncbi:C-GCAxxG-C-C family (seleno)protein [Serpentinicella alkaliphila]|uniref:C_GCAxxG_C_C family probable redox protein n=1 Tax=Serpentinicella alkaliphila TaxID=1734049 RepID=A0A4R2TUK9_9FIRM|nr:C-GCAxxG-C-C family (seleno)protein [Serpentinicella alkaliphila]QUH25632.1 C-GCAxxG-C-C family protein [Serpentinicella alkaliphila]TCQ06657.1 C_GCAxxG_C_C family probable redox protein [Serpentinicella alkaliphila]